MFEQQLIRTLKLEQDLEGFVRFLGLLLLDRWQPRQQDDLLSPILRPKDGKESKKIFASDWEVVAGHLALKAVKPTLLVMTSCGRSRWLDASAEGSMSTEKSRQ